MSTDIERQAQRPAGFDAVEVKHLGAVERREIARFLHFGDELCKHSVPERTDVAMIQRDERQFVQCGTDDEAQWIDIARQIALRQQAGALPMQRRLRQVEARTQVRQRQPDAGLCDFGDDAQRAFCR